MNEKEVKKYTCIRCGNKYNAGEECQNCKGIEENFINIKSEDKEETEECVENFEKIYNQIYLIMIIIGLFLLMAAIYLFIIIEYFKIIVFVGSIVILAIYVLICKIILTFTKWQKLLLKNIYEINKKQRHY